MIKKSKSPEDLANERAKKDQLRGTLRSWIDSGIPKDYNTWFYARSVDYREAVIVANKALSMAQPTVQKLQEAVHGLSGFYNH